MPWYVLYLWLAPIPLCILLMALMVRRGWQREFFFFFLYNLESAVDGIVFFLLYLAAKHGHLPYLSWKTYGYGYFVELSLNTALRFAVIYEVFVHVFRVYPSLKNLGKPVFRWALLLLLAIAVGIAAITQGHNPVFAMHALHVVEQTASILQLGLLTVLFLFSAYAGLSWRNFVFGIGLGLGIYACVKLGAAALQAAGLIRSGSVYVNVAVMGAFHLAVVIWLFYLLMPEHSTTHPPDHNISDWNRELQRLS